MIQKVKYIHEDDTLTRNLEQIEFLNPRFLYYPMTNARTKSCELYIKEGDYVRVGDVIGVRDGVFFKQNIHSTVSGTFVGVEKKFHRSGKKLDCIVIENDFKEELSSLVTDLSSEEIDNLTTLEKIERIENCSVVGLGGGGFPTAVKLKSEYEIEHIILNAVECEPYLQSDYIAMMKYSEEIVLGLKYLLDISSAENGYIAIKSKNVSAIEVMQDAVDKLGFTNIQVCPVGNYYPQGYEKDVIYSTLGIRIGVTQIPAKQGILVFNSTTAKSVYNALRYNIPDLERDFIINGQGIIIPSLLLIKVGTCVDDIIEIVGGYNPEVSEKDYILICGGPMMGTNIAGSDLVVSKAVSTVLLFPKLSEKEYPCVSCASCIMSCPSKLSPVSLMNAVKTSNKEAVVKLNINDCILCGMCSYVCTSKIHLTEFMRKAKKMV